MGPTDRPIGHSFRDNTQFRSEKDPLNPINLCVLEIFCLNYLGQSLSNAILFAQNMFQLTSKLFQPLPLKAKIPVQSKPGPACFGSLPGHQLMKCWLGTCLRMRISSGN